MSESKQEALQKAMRLCSRSEKSPKDIREKLKQWNISASFHEEILEELHAKNFLNNMRYAQGYVHDKAYLNQWGKQKICFALRLKDIPQETIERAIATIDEQRYEEGLAKLLQTKQKTLKAASDYEKIAKLIRFGQGRGFTMAEINKALNHIV